MDRTTTLELLQRSADDLEKLVQAIPADQLHWHEDNEWSAHETLSHVAEIERNVFLVRIHRVTNEDQPLLKYFDEIGWHQAHYDPGRPSADLLADFVNARQQEIDRLRGAADWTRWGWHETIQKRHTLDYLARYALNHTWEHLNQIATTQLHCELAKQ